MRRRLILLLAATTVGLISGCATPGSNVTPPGGWGKYIGRIRVEWEHGGRKMALLENTQYIAPNGVVWLGPKGWQIDGASIPQAFWCTIGGPYEGVYRDASVFHDVACDQRKARWQDVHYMFYTAMRCSGVDEEKAKIMYAAVYRFGPRWPDPTAVGAPTAMMTKAAMTPRQPTPAEAQEIADWVRNNNPSLKEIETTAAVPGRAGR
ncbi:MAG: DUF1353 domain-containing protein [Chthoniobacterales bacterium]